MSFLIFCLLYNIFLLLCIRAILSFFIISAPLLQILGILSRSTSLSWHYFLILYRFSLCCSVFLSFSHTSLGHSSFACLHLFPMFLFNVVYFCTTLWYCLLSRFHYHVKISLYIQNLLLLNRYHYFDDPLYILPAMYISTYCHRQIFASTRSFSKRIYISRYLY